MTDQQHPINPSWELQQQWREQAPRYRDGGAGREHWLTDRAAQWGADQELEACIAWMMKMGYWGEDGQAIPLLRLHRRPKPPSLKEQALVALEDANLDAVHYNIIRRALEALPDD